MFLPLRAAQALSAASKGEVRACPVPDTGRGMGPEKRTHGTLYENITDITPLRNVPVF
ncbi:MAG TPA: hypothetical protein VLK23_19025 [Thermodesulfobacteriota bacterium]|nr:hypothetical protein [Thermodesulfobacteriota bacterium]